MMCLYTNESGDVSSGGGGGGGRRKKPLTYIW